MEQKIRFGEQLDGIEYTVRQGVYAVIIEPQTHTIAVVKTPAGHFLPGGGIEHYESHEACLIRECLEELGCQISIINFIGTAERYFYSTSFNEHMVSDGYFYVAEITQQVQAPTEIDHELVWMTRDDVNNELFHEHQIWAVNKLFDAT